MMVAEMGETPFNKVIDVANSVQEQALKIQHDAENDYVKQLALEVARLGSAVEGTARKIKREEAKIK